MSMHEYFLAFFSLFYFGFSCRQVFTTTAFSEMEGQRRGSF
jgi:hypothetical protein